MRRLLILGVLLIVGLVLVAGCSSSTTTTTGGVTPTATETTTPPTQPPATLPGGTTLGSTGSSLQGAVSAAVLESSGYTAQCADCHGAKGEGGPKGPALAAYKDDTVILLTSAISKGVGSMPGFKDKLNAAQIGALVGLIKSGFGLSGTTTSS